MSHPVSIRARLLLGSAGALTMLLGTAAPAAVATHPGANGRIAFQRDDANGFTQVWTANPDLSAQQQLTAGDAYSGWVTWSPDASRIAFDSDRADPDRDDDLVVNDVFTMRADGGDVRKLTDSVGFNGDPAWSPDGSLVVFDSDRVAPGRELSIWVVDADGTGMRRVTTPPAENYDTEPRFSPDGSRILFTRYDGRVSAVFTMRLDGSGLTRVTGWGLKTGQADWSPDGRLIVFEQSCCRWGAGGIFTVPATGGAFTAVVNAHGITGIGTFATFNHRNEKSYDAVRLEGNYDPVWSPDGTKILAGRVWNDGDFRQGLVTVNPDGTGMELISPDVSFEHQPDWGTAPLQ